MNHDVTVHTGASDRARTWVGIRRKQSALQAGSRFPIRGITVVWAIMTFVAKERGARFQQWRDIGTVRRMTIRTVFCCWLMFPEEWAAFFRMAIPAGLINRIALDQFIAGRTMGVMAVSTSHFADFDRVRRNLVDVSTLFFVAGKADLSLGEFSENLVYGLVGFVTTIACQATVLMLAAVPVGSLGSLVTGQAWFCSFLFIGNRVDAFLEYDVRRCSAFDVRVSLEMLFAITVTGLAVGRATIPFNAVLGLIDREDGRGFAFIVTTRTDRIFLERVLGYCGFWRIAEIGLRQVDPGCP